MNEMKLTSAFLGALMLGGCASVHHVDSILPAEDSNHCWSTVKRDAVKNGEVIDSVIIDRSYSGSCGDRQVEAEKLAVLGKVEEARIKAISELLKHGRPDKVTNAQPIDFCFQKQKQKDGGLHFSCR